ncbi:MAG: polynucleotide adenylyltransferase PcnB [Acidobacteriota bacterium]
MPHPTIVPRADHAISRRDIDSDALKVLYRLHEHRYTAYLVGGSVRDLLLGRRPKDFDVGTDAHPYQIKKLFRNCWIIGRRFRLAHVKFGPKTIEVATFRNVVPPADPTAAAETEAVEPIVVATSPEPSPDAGPGQLHRDNTFGTPEEDAFRRDFTINGLFYDISTFSVIDYVGGLQDLDARVVRSIGDPRVRFVEDPVRMLRAVVMASRLDFDLDPLVVDAIAEHRQLIATASPARLLEEYYKILRSGCAEGTFRGLHETGLLKLITPELKAPTEALWESLADLDLYRTQFLSAPAELTNAILIGSLLIPMGLLGRAPAPRDPHQDKISFGMLTVARKDIERLRHLVQLLPKLADPMLAPRVARGLTHRPAFADTLLWMEIHGDSPDMVERWKETAAEDAAQRQAAHGHHAAHHAGEHGDHAHPAGPDTGEDGARPRRRRRRRRRGRSGGPAGPVGS